MYTIIKLLNGKYLGQFRLQDGTERYTFDTLEEAIKEAIQFARVLNGTKIKRKSITFLQEQPVTEIQYVPWSPKG